MKMIEIKRGNEILSVKETWVNYFLARGYELAGQEQEQEIKAVLKPPKKKTAQPIPAVETVEITVSDEEVGEDETKGD